MPEDLLPVGFHVHDRPFVDGLFTKSEVEMAEAALSDRCWRIAPLLELLIKASTTRMRPGHNIVVLQRSSDLANQAIH